MPDQPNEKTEGDPFKEPVPSNHRPPSGKPKKERKSSGKGLAALMLVVGLLIGMLLGGLLGIFAPRNGFLQSLPAPSEAGPESTPQPSPTTITRTVEVETLRTPRECVAALDDLMSQFDDLSEAREALMRADLARVSGNEDAAGSGLADVDRRLRLLIIAANTQSLRAAIETCRAEAGPQVGPAPDPEVSPVTEPPAPPLAPAPDELSPVPAPTGPAAGDQVG